VDGVAFNDFNDCGDGNSDKVRFDWQDTNGTPQFQDSSPFGQVNGNDDKFDEYVVSNCEDATANQID
jgi:hypothetical protein